MNKLLLIAFLIGAFGNTKAQDPDPNLFQLWYVNALTSESFGVVFSDDVDPPIEPLITISSEAGDIISINGFAGCNEFTATYTYDSDYEEMHLVNSTIGDLVCEDNIMQWELYMTNFFVDTIIYQITNNSSGQNLVLSNFIFETLSATNYVLNSDEFQKHTFAIYPNPTQQTLSWNSSFKGLVHARIYGTDGRLLRRIENSRSGIDISWLNPGLYFLELSTPEGRMTKQFVKQ